MSNRHATAATLAIDFLEPRRLLAAHAPDVAWGDAGFADLLGPAYFSGPAAGGKVMVLERLRDYTGIRFTRLNPDGSVDTTFGTAGHGPTMNFNFVDVLSAMQQPDGKIIVTGGDTLFVARFNVDGTIDSSFGSSGIARPLELVQGSQPTFKIGGLTLQSDGKVIAGGRISMHVTDHNADFAALYRFNADGLVDGTFGDQGRTLVDVENVAPTVITTLDNDKIFVVATGGNLARFNADGTPDLTFSDDGLATIETPITDEDFYSALHVGDGKLLLGGSSYEWFGFGSMTQSGQPLITRLNVDGSVDTTFGNDGFFTNNLGGGAPSWLEYITALAVDSTGRILASGFKPTNGTFRLFALTADGRSDIEYAPGGLIAAGNEFYANHIAIQSDGKVLVSGRGANQAGVLARVSVPAPVALGANGVVYVKGTELADSMTATPDGSKVVVTVNGDAYEYDASAVTGFDVEAFGGDDVITIAVGRGSNVRPGDGNDSVTTSIGDDLITKPESDLGRDTIRSSDGNDTINSGHGNDRIIAGSGQMVIDSGTGNDTVTVGDGRMNIELALGDDEIVTGMCDRSTIRGGWGDDDITTFGPVSIFAGPGYRQAQQPSLLTDDDTVAATGGRIRVDLEGGNNTCIISSRFDATVGGGLGDDLIITGSGDDHIDPINGNDTIYSNGGDDVLSNLGDSDLIDTGSGDDWVNSGQRGSFAPCTVDGGSGADSITLRGGGLVRGGSGNDFIDGRTDPNFPPDPSRSLVAHGHAGNDTIFGSDGRDRLYGGDDADRLEGGRSADRLFGGAGNDLLVGNGGGDIILGDSGIDMLFGNAGDDKLYCSDGEADTGNGGDGYDIYNPDEFDSVSNVEQVVP